jgi:hypothetical protein
MGRDNPDNTTYRKFFIWFAIKNTYICNHLKLKPLQLRNGTLSRFESANEQ